MNTRSPKTMGELWPLPGRGVVHAIFSVLLHRSGTPVSSLLPSPRGPRQPGQSAAAANGANERSQARNANGSDFTAGKRVFIGSVGEWVWPHRSGYFLRRSETATKDPAEAVNRGSRRCCGSSEILLTLSAVGKPSQIIGSLPSALRRKRQLRSRHPPHRRRQCTRRSVAAARFLTGAGAREGTRTLTPYGTRPSNVCVYQFHHPSISNEDGGIRVIAGGLSSPEIAATHFSAIAGRKRRARALRRKRAPDKSCRCIPARAWRRHPAFQPPTPHPRFLPPR